MNRGTFECTNPVICVVSKDWASSFKLAIGKVAVINGKRWIERQEPGCREAHVEHNLRLGVVVGKSGCRRDTRDNLVTSLAFEAGDVVDLEEIKDSSRGEVRMVTQRAKRCPTHSNFFFIPTLTK